MCANTDAPEPPFLGLLLRCCINSAPSWNWSPTSAGGSHMKSSLMLAAGAAAALGTLPATAQDDAGGLEEITITAQRRAENIQDVPIAVTAVSSEMLESRGISDVAKLSNIAPNVTLDAGTPFSGSDTVLAAYIRGIGQNDFAFNQDPGVGVYVDGLYLSH